ncbi:response regulator transcription factor [Actinocrispum sp. NPDC049592]|uniref:helix-turn-helix transcriptional regulator n=1 Tax=Actinocrispum sp. NPDC049592 TaxID=3154835 RepID=UPI003428D9E1
MDGSVPVKVVASDQFLAAGVTAVLRESHAVELDVADLPAVLLVAVDSVDDNAVDLLAGAKDEKWLGVVLLAGSVNPAGLRRAVDAGVCGVLRRRTATVPHLISTIRAASTGVATMPPDLLGEVFQLGNGSPAEEGPATLLTSREQAVLRLLADGQDTAEIARQLTYSVRTVTEIVHNVVHRLRLRNRAHAVAFALKEGLI